jgi:hypothetical protein
MNSITKTLLKLSSLSIIIFFSALAINASNYYTTNPHSKNGIIKKITKPTTTQKLLAQFDNRSIIEKEKVIESWMLDENFWIITDFYNWELEPEEQDKPIENWMLKISINPNNSQNDVVNEKEWMKKHSFYIL